MRRVLLFAIGAIVYCSCGNDFDYEVSPQDRDEVKANAENIFGVMFSSYQDWNAIQNGEITILANAAGLKDVVKVQILSCSPFGNGDGNGATILNEVEATAGEEVTLSYDAPTSSTRLFAACVSSDGTYRIKGFNVGQSSVEFTSSAASSRRASSQVQGAFPDLSKVIITRGTPSYNRIRTIEANNGYSSDNIGLWKGKGWENDYLWQVSDATEQLLQATIEDFTEDERADIQAIFSDYLDRTLVNNTKPDNLVKIKKSDTFVMDDNYLTCDGVNPIVINPVMLASNEIGSCHLYYYYYNPDDIAGMSEAEQIQYLKNLPKYKAIQLYRSAKEIGYNGKVNLFTSETIYKKYAYTIAYFGDETPVLNQTKAISYVFPEGYKIGFMLRKMKTGSGTDATTKFTAVNNGCVYADGRLNDAINLFPGHFGSANLAEGDPRAAIFEANGKIYMTFEDGADRQFSDLIIEIAGGVECPGLSLELDKNIYTFCFEDQLMGDYELNDIVIKAQRIDRTHVKYSLEACGAHDELYLRNIHGQILNENTEVHALFNVPRSTFINTLSSGTHIEPVQEIIEVSPSFSFSKLSQQIYIYNKTTHREIHLAGKGECPYAILIPYDFQYPVETVSINKAYPLFTIWGQFPDDYTDWYTYPDENFTYKLSVFQ